MIAPNGEVKLCYRNRAETGGGGGPCAEIIILMCEQRPYPIHMGFCGAARAIPYSVNTESVAEPSCFFQVGTM